MAFPHDGRKFKKGESGNMKGRPKKFPDLKEAFQKVIYETEGGSYEDQVQAIAVKLVEMARSGNLRAIEYLFSILYPDGISREELDDKKWVIHWGTLPGRDQANT